MNKKADKNKVKANSGNVIVDTDKHKTAQRKLKTDIAHKKVDRGHVKLDGTYLQTSLPGGKGIHMGYTIRRLLEKLKLSTPHLATLLGISRQSAHAMLKKKYLHAATLVKISEVLQHDVVRYLYRPEDLPANAALKKKAEELEKENAALKKENEMLKKMVKLLEKG